MSNPYTMTYRYRREVENCIAPLVDARTRLMPVITRMSQRAKTPAEGHDVLELIMVRRDIDRARDRIAALHQDHRR